MNSREYLAEFSKAALANQVLERMQKQYEG